MTLLAGKTAIVTGGSRGIGFTTAKTFLENGARVALCTSRKETADAALVKLRTLFPEEQVMAITPKLSDRISVEESFAAVRETLGPVDILVNNAGITSSTRLGEYTDEELDQVMDVNVRAVINCSRAVVNGGMKERGGVILNTSSMVSRYGQATGVAYPASKFAVNGITISLAKELAPFGIRVCAVAPGVISTDMMRSVPEEVLERLVKTIPLRRIGQPEDIANAFLFLASDLAGYITGVVLSVDGMCQT